MGEMGKTRKGVRESAAVILLYESIDNRLLPFPRALETRGSVGYPTSWRISDISGVLIE